MPRMSQGIQIIDGIDVTSDADMKKLTAAITAPVDVLINNAGYFKSECEKITAETKEEAMDFADQVLPCIACDTNAPQCLARTRATIRTCRSRPSTSAPWACCA